MSSAETGALRGTLEGQNGEPVVVGGCVSGSALLSVDAEKRGDGNGAKLEGFKEFSDNASTPPKAYLTYTISGGVGRCFYKNQGGNCDFIDLHSELYPTLEGSNVDAEISGSFTLLDVTYPHY